MTLNDARKNTLRDPRNLGVARCYDSQGALSAGNQLHFAG